MSRLAASFVLGYHGCDREIAEQVITGKTFLVASDKPYDGWVPASISGNRIRIMPWNGRGSAAPNAAANRP